jgi:hypothetical protein
MFTGTSILRGYMLRRRGRAPRRVRARGNDDPRSENPLLIDRNTTLDRQGRFFEVGDVVIESDRE